MHKIIRQPLAKVDLKNIWRYIAQDNSRIADQFLLKLEKQILSLKRFPVLGTKRNNLREDLRLLTYKGYNIYYMQDKTTVTIIRILHGSRQISDLF